MIKLMNNWYWARAKIGEYTVIACYITAEKDYGYTTFPVFMLARDGRVLADDARKVHFHTSDLHTDNLTGKPVANVITYDYWDDKQHYCISFKREKDTLRHQFIASFACSPYESGERLSLKLWQVTDDRVTLETGDFRIFSKLRGCLLRDLLLRLFHGNTNVVLRH
jgi:hypothetical protein